MKKIIIPISTLLFSNITYAQLSTKENYVYSKTHLDYNGISSTKSIETVQYFDGLGRPKQIVNIKASPLGKDVVTYIEYDDFGRQVKDYFPVPQTGTQSGGIYSNPLANVPNTPYGAEKIYEEKILENSPLDRIQQQIQVGNDWTTKPVKFDYDANIHEDYVRKYETTTTWVEGRTQTSVQLLQYFLPNQLYKDTVTDEDGNKTIEFKNGEGQTLLVRKVLSATENADTYYVYNEYNQLTYVIPPLAVGTSIDLTTLNNLCYQYRYDSRNRLVEKKLPGKGLDPTTGIWHWEYMIYDKADRLIATQDPNLKKTSTWFVTKYDNFGRVIYTGLMPLPNQTREGLQSITNQYVIIESRNNTGFSRNGMQIYYTNDLYNQIETVLSVNYYDTYPKGSPTIPTQVLGQIVLPQDAQNSNISTKSLPVASYVKNIEDDNWTKNYTWYDTKGRTIGNHSINYLGGSTKTESALDFAGVSQQKITMHKRLNTDIEKVITETFTYDGQNRQLTQTHKVDNNPLEYLAQNEYNELSQLKTKKVGGVSVSTPLQTIDYRYNIRGWMTNINDPANLGGDLFGYKINYNQREGLESPDAFETNLKVLPRYNGNIAEVQWKTATNYNDYLRRYGYVYDGLNRLLAGFYQNEANPSAGEYYEKMTYDLNGNIKTLKRTSNLSTTGVANNVDDLNYVYENSNQSNRLNTVTETAQNYGGYPDASGNMIGYDLNGNMEDEKDKGILKINYNVLNLPNYFKFDTEYIIRNFVTGEDEMRNVRLDYLYGADGTKLRKKYTYYVNKNKSERYSGTDYLDGFQYSGSQLGIINLEILQTSEGYYDFRNNRYVYNYTDHLGNVRLSYHKDYLGNAYPNDENNYYPFGLRHEGYNNPGVNGSYNYKYNNKELQLETGMYDYGARFYMPDLGRWGVVDPLAEQFPGWTPYAYTFNNPIRFTDPDGQAPNDIVYINNRGVEVHRIKSETQFRTYIQATNNASSDPSRSTVGWKQVAMPNIIQNKGGEDVSGSEYQKNDYQIAARTGYFNQAKNSGKLNLVTEGGNSIPQEALKRIADLDPTLVKAMTVQESNAGTTGVTDIMQTNVKGDWKGGEMKSKYFLKQGEGADVSTSLYAGVRILATKGFKGGITYDPKTGKSTYNFKGWFNAAGAYNSTAGTKGYQSDVQKMYQNSTKPTSKDYK